MCKKASIVQAVKVKTESGKYVTRFIRHPRVTNDCTPVKHYIQPPVKREKLGLT